MIGSRHAGRCREALDWIERVLHCGSSGAERGLALIAGVRCSPIAWWSWLGCRASKLVLELTAAIRGSRKWDTSGTARSTRWPNYESG